MKLTSTYNVRLAKDINVCLDDTLVIYRKAVDFYIGVMLNEWDETFAYVMNGNASYNIGSRYYIREILGEMTEKSRLSVSAKVPSLIQRSTCTLSTLYDLHAAVNGVPMMRSECIMSEETKDSDALQRQPTRAVGNRMHATLVV